jgi:hypothetical protein
MFFGTHTSLLYNPLRGRGGILYMFYKTFKIKMYFYICYETIIYFKYIIVMNYKHLNYIQLNYIFYFIFNNLKYIYFCMLPSWNKMKDLLSMILQSYSSHAL